MSRRVRAAFAVLGGGSLALVAGELLHHQAGPTARDMRHDGRAAVDLRHQPQVDRERELYLLSLAQTQIFRLDEHAVGAQILRLADSALRPDMTT